MSEDDEPQRKKVKRSGTWAMLDKIDKCRNRYKEVLSKLKKAIEDEITKNPDSRVREWSEEISCLEENIKFPETKIGMIGSTGVGKSSLINAILDHKELLPTSGSKACTSAVIEVMENTLGTDFEAEIVFLEEEEWKNELRILLQDLRNQDGQIENYSTDTGEEYRVSLAKIQAVYGGDINITSAEDLSQLTSPITASLGKVEKIKCASAEELSEKISIYTEEGNSDESGQYWPIVKQVVLKLPNCDACSSGAILVDLPGIGDTNVARNKKSEEYMKDCAALWIGSVIKRATCDQVARYLLGDNFRQQLHVDGKYGTSDTLAFICTMTDDVYPTEIIRALNLQNETRELQENMGQARDRIKCIERKFKADKAQLDRELREMKEKADRAENLNLHLDPDSSNQKDYDDDLKSKKELIAKLEIEIMDLNAEKERQVYKIDKEIAGYEKNVAAICALKRNQDSKRVIQQDFKEGLMLSGRNIVPHACVAVEENPVKRTFRGAPNTLLRNLRLKQIIGTVRSCMAIDKELRRNRPGGENEETGGGDDGDNLPVFCCSSLEYQKIKEPGSVDGKPKVFSVQEDTQIPDLREYVHTVMSRRKQYFAKKLLESFRAITFRLKNSIFDRNTTSCESFLRVMDDFDEKLKKRILENLSPQIDKLFKDILYNKMLDGAKEAERKAPEICASWSKPVNKNNKTDRSSGGVDWRTYKSTVDKCGEYISKTYARLDFNEQLSSPMVSSFFLHWENIFNNSSNGKLLEILIKMQTDFLMLLDETMQTPFSAEEDQNEEFMDTYSHFTDGLKERALLRLKGMVAEVRDTKLNRHQVIYRLIKPHIQSTLVKAYTDCSLEFGNNMFVRMKDHMSLAVETKRHTMFEAAAQKVMEELNKLKKSIMELVERTCTSLVGEFRNNYEQLFENESQFTAEFVQTIRWVDEEVNSICVEADMECLEENIPAASSAQH